jgi:hypothetical protein
VITVKKEKEDGFEFLPYPEYVITSEPNTWNRSQKRVYDVYKAIRDVEMYFQENTPTAFGNPEYFRRDGFLSGVLTGYGLIYKEKNGYICIYCGKNCILKVEKLTLPESYHEEIRDINRLMSYIL